MLCYWHFEHQSSLDACYLLCTVCTVTSFLAVRPTTMSPDTTDDKNASYTVCFTAFLTTMTAFLESLSALDYDRL